MPAPWSMPGHLIWAVTGANAYDGQAGSLPLQSGDTNHNGVSPIIDVGGYRELLLIVNLISFTGGTAPSFQPEWDMVDDAVPADVAALWKPTAATAATKWIEALGVGVGAGPTIAGFTVGNVNFPFGAFGQFVWTLVGAPTAVNWKAYLYGK